ncbi:Eukaryotic initiation factor 4A-III [Mortierella sp. AM989]|nr:Eukaryotic initiation factor 4A-III [Mortierella sp. AM989]
MSQTTLAELSISLTNVQSLLKQITAEVKVLSDGIAVLVEQEEAEDLEEELNYLDVDPWSNVKDKDKNAATASRRDSVRSLMQRKPSTVKDETKALARILSQKRPAGGGAGSGSESEKQQQQQQQAQQSQQPGSRWSNSNLQDQTIDEDNTSSEGSSSYRGGKRYSPTAEKQELDSTSDLTAGTITSVASGSPTPQHEAERVPHTITVQTTPMPTKFPIAITKPITPQSPSTPVLSASSSQSSILSSMNNHNTIGTGSIPPFWRSSTAPVMGEGSRPTSAIGNLNSDGYLSRSSIQNITQRRSVQPEPRNNVDNQAITHNSIKERYNALRSNSQGAVLHPAVGKDASKSIFTINSPKPMVAAQVEKMESADCFSKLGLIPELLRGIYAYGLKMPSILQQRGIPMIMTKHDVLTQAKPEVAKTLTYAIPLLNFLTLPATSIHPQLLILCSNHDLCLHVQRVLLALARFMPTISCLICADGNNATLSLGTMSTTKVNVAGHGNRNSQNGHGSRGSSYSEPPQVIAAHVVIGTPGNVLNLIRTKQISISALKVMVLENADILLATPLKEATISLLSMIRDPSTGTSGSTVGGTVSEPLISPPNSGPTSPVSMAVAALNGRIIGSNGSGSSSAGGAARFPGAYNEPESRPRSMSGTSGTISTTSSAAVTNQPQLLFFSTEVPSHVLDYVAQYMTQPTKALVKGHELALKGILQFFKYMTVEDEEWQLELLCELLEDSGVNRAVVFCNKDDSVERIVRKVRERKGFAIGAYSDMDIATRKSAISRFRAASAPVYFILTDEAAKDLDILAVPLVVSFEIPSISTYIPRVKWIDRSKGKLGAKVTLVDGHRGEGQVLRAIQQHYRTAIDDMPVSIAEFIIS